MTRNGSSWQRRQREFAAIQIESHRVVSKEAVADDSPEFEAEEHARRPQIEDDGREVLEADAIECQIQSRQQERLAISF